MFFASLRERLKQDLVYLNCHDNITAEEVWRHSRGEKEMPTNILISINQEYGNLTTKIYPGDEAAFFPPATGG